MAGVALIFSEQPAIGVIAIVTNFGESAPSQVFRWNRAPILNKCLNLEFSSIKQDLTGLFILKLTETSSITRKLLIPVYIIIPGPSR